MPTPQSYSRGPLSSSRPVSVAGTWHAKTPRDAWNHGEYQALQYLFFLNTHIRVIKFNF